MPEKSTKQTYAAAGVDRDGHSDITQGLRSRLTMNDPRILNRVGAFASLFEAELSGNLRPGAGTESRRTRLQAIISQAI